MKIAVVGGGASGLMAAIVASQKHSVTVFERQNRVGKKLFASGNGKCNLTNSALTRENLQKPNDFYNCQQAKEVVLRDKKPTISYVQRRLGVGYNKAAGFIERMEQEGIVSAPDASGKRQVL